MIKEATPAMRPLVLQECFCPVDIGKILLIIVSSVDYI